MQVSQSGAAQPQYRLALCQLHCVSFNWVQHVVNTVLSVDTVLSDEISQMVVKERKNNESEGGTQSLPILPRFRQRRRASASFDAQIIVNLLRTRTNTTHFAFPRTHNILRHACQINHVHVRLQKRRPLERIKDHCHSTYSQELAPPVYTFISYLDRHQIPSECAFAQARSLSIPCRHSLNLHSNRGHS